MGLIEREEDEQMYKDTTSLVKRQLTDEVLREPLSHVECSNATCFAPDTCIQQVVETMREARMGAVLITDPESGKLIGIFTERDLLNRVAGRGWNWRERKIGEVMTANPETLTPRDLVGYALNMMMTHGYRHIPIVKRKGEPWGMISVRNILHFLCEHFPEDVINLPPSPQMPSSREGG
ncbi:MAG: CBS domain-containing protein [Planctomycetota bacterium]|nr:CBS domain-containing protein [Planctomycetota bacterium]